MILRAGRGRLVALAALTIACGRPPARPLPVVETPRVADAGAIPPKVQAQCNATTTPLAPHQRPFPIESWHVAAAAVAGDELVLLRYVEERGGERRETSLLERRPLADAKTVRARVFLDAKSHAFALTQDARTLVLQEGKEIVFRARETGAALGRFAAEPQSEPGLVPIGKDEALQVLASVGGVATLFDRKGKVLDRFPIEGRTPTIIRRYGVDPDHPTVHENILRESPTWVSSLAATDDARRIAIGGSDGKVRLVDRRTKQTRVLDHKWTMVDRRTMGANPDLNRPLAMRFSDDGARITVAFGKGEILTWSTDGGALVSTAQGQCTPEEASRVANRFTPKGDPTQTPTADDERNCARAEHAAFARDGSWVAMDGDLVRVRALPSGTPIAMIADEPDTAGPDKLVVTTNGELLMGDIYGSVRSWSRGHDARSIVPKSPMTSPMRVHLTRGARFLTWDGRPTEKSTVFDLVTGKTRSAVDGWMATADDGRIVKWTGDSVEVVDGAGERVFLVKDETSRGHTDYLLSEDGRTLLSSLLAKDGVMVHELASRRATKLPVDAGTFHRVLSADGRKVAAFGRTAPLRIWDVATAKAIDGPTGEVSAAAFFADGSLAATYVEGKGAASLRVLDPTGALKKTIPLQGWVSGIAVAQDDGEVTVLLSQSIVRFEPRTFEKKADPPVGWTGALAVSYATSGPTLFFESYGLLDIRRRSDLSRVAQIAAVSPGDWMITNEVGAVEGSAGAAAATMLGASGGFADGREAFERARAPHVLACAVMGVSVGR